jgi:hypothetical protein
MDEGGNPRVRLPFDFWLVRFMFPRGAEPAHAANSHEHLHQPSTVLMVMYSAFVHLSCVPAIMATDSNVWPAVAKILSRQAWGARPHILVPY